jgi:diguanylate cyclase (GGDEF)-like protein
MLPRDSVKVLYIEDDRSARILLKKILSKPPFLYFEAADGMEGMKIALQQHPQLIVMDIDLPDIRGDELATQLKNTKELKEVIIVALTALKEEDAKEKILIAGCDGFITKPIDVQKFPGQLLQFLEGKKEEVESERREIVHQEYEKSVVDHLTQKVKELEIFNKKLESTSQRLKEHGQSLENVLGILSSLQTCTNPVTFKKIIVDEICQRFQFERCAFIDVNSENMMMQIKYAHGMKQEEWEKYRFPVETPFLHKYFEENNVLQVQSLDQIEDPKLRGFLENFKASNFIFAYLGTPPGQYRSSSMRERVLPLLESFMPSLVNQEDLDIEIILSNLEEYLSSESLYRAGFIFMDNYQSQRNLISGGEYRFLETLIRTASYMYQNLTLMEHLRFLFVKAEKEAITDPLTELYNYRYFLLQLNREVSRAQRHKSVFSLIMIDIDFFKSYNDAFGHQAGDLILRRIAHAMLENTRNSDMVCRYGGEEFCIICPELTKEDAKKTAEKLRQMVRTLELPIIKSLPTGYLTISSGIASFPDDGNNAYQLILNADKALYRAKESGRNQVCVVSK